MSITGPGSITALNLAAQTGMFKELNTLAQELGSGQAAQTYSGLGSQAGLVTALNAQVSQIDGYTATANSVGTNLTIAQSALTQIDAAGHAVTQAIAQQGQFAVDNTGQTTTQEAATNYLDEIFGLLNTQVGDNYLFSGTATTTPSVAPTDAILNGNGAQAGLSQVIAERQQADLGTGGAGRLSISSVVGSSFSVTQDASPFGFKLTGATTTIAGATITGPSGSPPSISVTLGANANSGDTIQFGLTLPDGSTQAISLKATTASPPGPGQFTIGTNAALTAGNLQAALSSAVTTLAQTALPAASAIAAANDFFNSNPPQRVNGPPFDTATSLVAGTPANTVFWYTGENGALPARQTATAQVGPSASIAFGMRANEPAFSSMIAAIGALAATTYSPSDPNAQASYQALSAGVQAALAGQPGAQTVNDIAAELANAQTTIKDAGTVNTQTKQTLQNMLQGIDGVDQNQIGEQILALQNALSASMSVSARLAQLSLVNFLGPA
jgi:hypothetical protein